MQGRTINNALLALRRDGGQVQELAERLLAMRGVNHLPRMIEAPAKRGQMQRLVLEALREGPKTRAALVEWIAPKRPDAPPDRLYWRVDGALGKLRRKGAVRREGRVWLAP